jgi:outer membrane protein
MITIVGAAIAALVFGAKEMPRVLTLEEALDTAAKNQPQLRAAEAQLRASAARVGQAESAFLPRLDATAQYQRTTANFVLTPAFAKSPLALPTPGMPPAITIGQSFHAVDYYQFGAVAQVTLYDFGRTGGGLDVASEGEKAQKADLDTQAQSIALNVRVAFFNVLASKELVFIGEQTVSNQAKHVRQIREFVEAGTRPKIDLTSAELNLANAELTLVRARNSLSLSKVALNNTMGVEGSIDYEVAVPKDAATKSEAETIAALIDEAVSVRPEFVRLNAQLKQLEAQRAISRSAYFPQLFASASFSGATVDLYPWYSTVFPLGFNLYAGVGINWNLFQGFLTKEQLAEIEANVEALADQRDLLRQAIRSDLEQQLLSVDEAKKRLDVAERAVLTADERLRLAEGRYQAGTSDILELDDAQVTDANAKAQRVQAQYDLATARARLLHAVGNE